MLSTDARVALAKARARQPGDDAAPQSMTTTKEETP